LKATEGDQQQWMSETIEYIGERFPDLTDEELVRLREIGMRFCKPAISRRPASTETSMEGANVA
jgi:hypothetical protein